MYFSSDYDIRALNHSFENGFHYFEGTFPLQKEVIPNMTPPMTPQYDLRVQSPPKDLTRQLG